VIGERAAEPTSYDTFLGLQEANALLRLGRVDEADRRLPERVPGDAMGTTARFLHFLRAAIAMLKGDRAAWERELETLNGMLEGADDPQWHEPLAMMSAELALADGRIPDARAAIADGFAALACAEDVLRATRLVSMGLRVEADAGAPGGPGADDWAVESNESMLEALEEDPALFGEGPPNLVMARAELARLRGDGAEEAFREAADAFEAIGLPVPVAYARFREGEALMAGGERQAAGAALRVAHAAVLEIGLNTLREEIEALARRARVDLDVAAEEPAAEEPDDPASRLGLTPRELEVLLLVAEGRTNREIGAELFMSEKTASVHVSRILAKLDVSSRVEAAAVAHRLGLTAATQG
jgi:DNA-binding NarL/FixJ family response regulator